MAITSRIDVGKLAEALRRPGNDPRINITMAKIEDVAVDPDFGIFADITILPDGEKETCLIGSEYAGNDFGLFMGAPKVGDVILVAMPHGEPGFGAVMIRRLFSTKLKPPSEFAAEGGDPMDATNNPTLVIEPGTTLRIIGRPGSKVEIAGDSEIVVDSPDVKLGTHDDAPGVARNGDAVDVGKLSFVPGSGGASLTYNGQPVTPTGTEITGKITEGSSRVKASD